MSSTTNELLGYPADARLLILNADDYGMCHSINVGIMQAINEGLVASCTLMVPCPWSLHGIHLLQQNPDVPFGVHLTAISEAEDLRWGPVVCRDKVPSLVDEHGYFYALTRRDEFLDQVNIDELEMEFRAQIKHVLNAGLKPTHLDSHCNVHTERPFTFDMTYKLAKEYGLALRVHEQAHIEKVRQTNQPANDHDVLDSYGLDPATKAEAYHQMLRDLPAGLTEWALHPGIGTEELKAAIGPSWDTRQADYDVFMSADTRKIIEEEGIVILDYKTLQPLWN